MALDPYVTQSVAQSMLTALETAFNAGTAAVINIYESNPSIPADADASLASATLLAQLTCAASVFTSKTDGAPGAVGTFDTITQDSDADATGDADFFRILTQSGGTVVFQGTVGTATSDMIANTTAITENSVVAATGTSTITVPEGN